jgi:DnaJ-class molecular chaperone
MGDGVNMKKTYPVKPPAPVGEVYEQKCHHCRGSGQEPGLPDLTCRECMGRGRRKWRLEECPDCRGRGRQNFLFKCKQCRGRGWLGRDIG